MSERADLQKFRRACAALNKLGVSGYHFFTNGGSLHILNKAKAEGGEVLDTAPLANIDGGDW